MCVQKRTSKRACCGATPCILSVPEHSSVCACVCTSQHNSLPPAAVRYCSARVCALRMGCRLCTCCYRLAMLFVASPNGLLYVVENNVRVACATCPAPLPRGAHCMCHQRHRACRQAHARLQQATMLSAQPWFAQAATVGVTAQKLTPMPHRLLPSLAAPPGKPRPLNRPREAVSRLPGRQA